MNTTQNLQLKTLNSILIANRGEISSRVSRTCKKMGIKSIAVFSDADRGMPFTMDADISIHIGESAPSKSYLDQDKIISAAKRVGADAIHPGYGFLSENADFARRCEKEGIIFIGPHPHAIESMGSKSDAKNLMIDHGVPVVPGYQGNDQSLKRLTLEAEKIGYPLLLKATAGGGGKGMRIVHSKNEIAQAIAQAKRESKNAFGDDDLIVEKYVASGRHIEFQIFGDKHGNAIHLLERECTIQRRYQKVIEESPSPVMTDSLRNRMGEAAVKVVKALSYDNAGTVEFIYDEESEEFYFLEVNTRLQVEHPVTEEVTGLDLVKMQIESAQGYPLNIEQKEVKGRGYALEARLYAEDTANDFLPVTGKIERFKVPAVEGLRVESAVQSGSEISIYYDPMIAKIIIWDESREGAHRKMLYVLKNMVCLGTTTNQSFLKDILLDSDFNSGDYDTHYIDDKIEAWNSKKETNIDEALIAATLFKWEKRENSRRLLKAMPSGWRNSFYEHQTDAFMIGEKEKDVKYRFDGDSFEFLVGDETHIISNPKFDKNGLSVDIDGIVSRFDLACKGMHHFIQNEKLGTVDVKLIERLPLKEKEKIKGGYESPMPSQIVKVLVKVGQKVKSGDGLVVLSSMKMENTIEASEEGVVEEVFVKEGGNVEAGFLLMKIV